jgi:hypothetical protein
MRASIEAAAIRDEARALGFEDWATGDIASLETDIRASRILRLSRQLRAAAERSDYADVVTHASAIVAYIQDRPADDNRSANLPD